jgi:DNA-binding transcriptional LysR family regulator
MDRLDAMRLFTRVVERRSFTAAANDLAVPRSTCTKVIREMEGRLGVRLLQRTTRVVRPTLDGEAYYQRCLAILDDIEDAEGALGGARPRGLLRVEVQGTLSRYFLMPGLPEFQARYPDIELSISEGERYVDLVREGVDCALRYGKLRDSDLVARTVGTLQRVTCAAPAYLERHGQPARIEDLAGHRMVGLRSITTGSLAPLEFQQDGGPLRTLSLPCAISLTGTESYLAAIRLGMGLAQAPLFHVAEDLARGLLVPLLQHSPPPGAPISLLYARSRQLAPRVRVFLDWAAQAIAARHQALITSTPSMTDTTISSNDTRWRP